MSDIRYNHLYEIRVTENERYLAKLIHLNPRFHRKVDKDKLDVWKIENPKPGQKRYVMHSPAIVVLEPTGDGYV